MTPRPPTHREPTDEECQHLPPGSLFDNGEIWKPVKHVGETIRPWFKNLYAVPITKQEEVTLPAPPDMPLLTWMTGQALATLRAEDFTNPTWTYDMAGQAIGIAEAVLEKLAARNSQPEKV